MMTMTMTTTTKTKRFVLAFDFLSVTSIYTERIYVCVYVCGCDSVSIHTSFFLLVCCNEYATWMDVWYARWILWWTISAMVVRLIFISLSQSLFIILTLAFVFVMFIFLWFDFDLSDSCTVRLCCWDEKKGICMKMIKLQLKLLNFTAQRKVKKKGRELKIHEYK